MKIYIFQKLSLKWLLIGLLSFMVQSIQAYDFKADGIFYNILSSEQHTVEVTYNTYGDYQGDLIIPDFVEYQGEEYQVVSIGMEAFTICMELHSVSIPSTVTSIGDSAFLSCSSLTEVNLPNSITYLGRQAFWGCIGLKSIVIPDSITEILEWTFNSCLSLENVELSNSLISIGEYAFYACYSLTSIDIPASVIKIADWAFNSCISMTSINVDSKNSNYRSYDGILYDKSLETLVVCPGGKEKANLAESLISISDYAFFECGNLIAIEIPSLVNHIGNQAFGYCYEMEEIKVATDNETYESYDGVLYEKGCKTLKTCPAGKLEININENTETIEAYSFGGCQYLVSIVLPQKLYYIQNNAFMSCASLTYITFNDKLESIGEFAFYNCNNLHDAILGNSLKSIKDFAFYGCYSMQEVSLGNELSEIGDGAFSFCSSIDNIKCHAPHPPVISEYTFDEITYNTATLSVPADSEILYSTTNPWSLFKNIEGGLESKVNMEVNDRVVLTVKDGNIKIDGKAESMPVFITTLSGEVVYYGYDNIISGLSKGVYILKFGNQIKKILL